MASKRLLDKRREHEAAEKQGKVPKGKAAAGKKAPRKATTRKRKAKAPERKRLLWGVFSGTLKEEGRFLWNEKDKAEEKLALLRSKSKKLYFIQPIKESISSDSARPADEAPAPADEEEVVEEEALRDDEDEVEEADEAEDADDDSEE
jgi:hypothetical protein